MEQTWIFPMTAPTLHFSGKIGQLIGRYVQLGSPAERRIQLSSLSQIRSLSVPLFNTLEHIYVHNPQHLRRSTYVKDLVLYVQWVRHVAPTLQELAREGAPEVLPALQFLPGNHSHRDLSRKRFGSSLPRDGSPAVLWLSTGYEGVGGKRVGGW